MLLMTVASRISPAWRRTEGRRTVTEPSSATSWIVTSVASPTVTDRSLDRRSPLYRGHVGLQSGDHAPIE